MMSEERCSVNRLREDKLSLVWTQRWFGDWLELLPEKLIRPERLERVEDGEKVDREQIHILDQLRKGQEPENVKIKKKFPHFFTILKLFLKRGTGTQKMSEMTLKGLLK